jgi:hypothetical protein
MDMGIWPIQFPHDHRPTRMNDARRRAYARWKRLSRVTEAEHAFDRPESRAWPEAGQEGTGARPSSVPGARRDTGRGASAGLGRDEKEPVAAGHDRPGAGVLVQGAEAVPVYLEAVPWD